MVASKHWTEIDTKEWAKLWPNFTPQEMASKDYDVSKAGQVFMEPEVMTKLQTLRNELGIPLIVTSGYRTPAHNAEVGGHPKSLHLQGRAVDISTINVDPDVLEATARKVGFTGVLRYPKQRFIHVQLGEAIDGGAAFPKKPTRFDPTPTPAAPAASAETMPVLGLLAALTAAANAFNAGDLVQFSNTVTALLNTQAPVVGRIVAGAQTPLGMIALVTAAGYAYMQGWVHKLWMRMRRTDL